MYRNEHSSNHDKHGPLRMPAARSAYCCISKTITILLHEHSLNQTGCEEHVDRYQALYRVQTEYYCCVDWPFASERAFVALSSQKECTPSKEGFSAAASVHPAYCCVNPQLSIFEREILQLFVEFILTSRNEGEHRIRRKKIVAL